jgi:hypothetical protein
MPLQPLTVTLTDGQKAEVMKRFRAKYAEDLTKVESDLTDVLTAIAEADYLVQYLGEQPELKELKKRQAEVDALQQRRVYLGKIIERLDQYTPQLKPVTVAAPAGSPGNPGGAAKPGGIKRY